MFEYARFAGNSIRDSGVAFGMCRRSHRKSACFRLKSPNTGELS
jgi:hypothetical protein